ncbi:YdeI/OmpD-associated family protein [Pseudarthrobacter sp. YAF2]|uniref:YdeI/OmpD-associated family protein n=1 Tax=Pseudarthrobacter sp. YAF2 TaxID=3233078 RepID=UPI003F9C7C93
MSQRLKIVVQPPPPWLATRQRLAPFRLLLQPNFVEESNLGLPPSAGSAFPAAAERFRSLSYSNQRRHVLAVTGARTEETRSRRIAAVLAELG